MPRRPADAGGAGEPPARHQDRPDRDPTDRAHPGRAHHRCRTGGADQDSARRAGDRSRHRHRPARPGRRPHPYVQRPPARHVAGGVHAHRHTEHAERPAGRHHHRARHEHPRQRLRRRRHAQRHQRGPAGRATLSGVGTRHRVGRHGAGGGGAAQSADQRGGAFGRGGARGGARAHPARHRLDQAVSGRRLSLHAERRGPIRGDLSDAGPVGA